MPRHLLPFALLLLAGCPSASRDVDEYVVSCEAAAVGQPSTSDENFIRFAEAEAAGRFSADACRSPELLTPAPGTALDLNGPPVISFRPAHADCAGAAPVDGPLGCRARPRPSAAERTLSFAADLVVPTAHAHCAAFTGDNYLLRVTVAGEARPLYTAMLSVTSFTPDAQAWKRALSGRSGQSVSLTIARGGFLRGDLNEGPYVRPQPYTFTLAQ